MKDVMEFWGDGSDLEEGSLEQGSDGVCDKLNVFGEGMECAALRVVDYNSNFFGGKPPDNNSLGIDVIDSHWGVEADPDAYFHVSNSLARSGLFESEEDEE